MITFPKCNKIQIESTNVCNFNCQMCPRIVMKRPLKHMKITTYQKVISNIGRIKHIDLTGWGEPLTNPDIFKMVYLARKIAPNVSFTTNASLLQKNNAKKLAQSGITSLSVSLDSIDGSATLGHESSDALKNLQQLKKSYPRIEIKIQTTYIGQSVTTLEKIIKYALKIQASEIRLIRFDQRYSSQEVEILDEKEVFYRLKKKWGRRIKITMAQYSVFSDWRDLPYLFAQRLAPKLCPKLIFSANVNVDGYLTPCCSLPEYRITDLKKNTLSSAWSSNKFKNFRKNYLTHCGNCEVLTR